MKTKTSWREKLEKPQQPKIVKVPPKMARFGKRMMLVPTPKLVEDLLRRVPKGRLVTVSEIRRKLAADFSAEVTCPLTTGIFIRIVAEAAEEERLRGRKRVTSYWRVIKDDGQLNPKFPGGVANQARYLRAEGHNVVPHGKDARVIRNFERGLFRFN